MVAFEHQAKMFVVRSNTNEKQPQRQQQCMHQKNAITKKQRLRQRQELRQEQLQWNYTKNKYKDNARRHTTQIRKYEKRTHEKTTTTATTRHTSKDAHANAPTASKNEKYKTPVKTTFSKNFYFHNAANAISRRNVDS